MDKESKVLLNLIQSNFPIESRPFLKIAKEMNTTEEHIISIIQQLKNSGDIRRIGGIFDPRKLGYYSTLCAMKVLPERIQEVAEIVNSYNGVTHNYIRNHSYNMWFTIAAPSVDEIKDLLDDIRMKTGIDEILDLPAVDVYKINVNFDIRE